MRQYPVRAFILSLSTLLLSVTIGCHAQTPAPEGQLSPELARRIEVLLRARTKMPPDYTVTIGQRSHSDVPGYDQIPVTFSSADHPPGKPLTFLVSKDGKTLGQFTTYDIADDPRGIVSATGRPSRGGPEGAPVDVVGFDDLECPYCAKMHAALFPALVQRYGDKVHIIYRDYPLVSLHPWAMRAAVDTNCVIAQSGTAYWNLVDYIHAHASEIGLPEKTVDKANMMLDKITLDEAKKDNLKIEPIDACLRKQDETAIKASMKVGDGLDIGATPILYINGEKFEGAYPIEDFFRMVDGALRAAGQTPPPPYVAPAPAAATPTPR
jgi:protein-disulfide isomerase